MFNENLEQVLGGMMAGKMNLRYCRSQLNRIKAEIETLNEMLDDIDQETSDSNKELLTGYFNEKKEKIVTHLDNVNIL